MLINSFCRSNVAQRSKEIQREAAKTAESLERLLCLAKRGEDVKSKKSEEAIDDAIEKLGVLRSRTVQLGELRQIIGNLENAVREKKFDGRKEVEGIASQVEQTMLQIDALCHEREVLSAQIMAAHALHNFEKRERVEHPQADGELSNSSFYSHGGTTPGDRIVISDYRKGDWDDKVTDDFPDK